MKYTCYYLFCFLCLLLRFFHSLAVIHWIFQFLAQSSVVVRHTIVHHHGWFLVIVAWFFQYFVKNSICCRLHIQARSWVSSRGVRRVKMLRVKKRAPNARAARGSGGMLPREILKIVVLYNDFSCILSPLLYHFGWPLKAMSHEATCNATFAVKNIAGCS